MCRSGERLRGGNKAVNYGALTPTDAACMDWVLGEVLPVVLKRIPPVAYVVETGTHNGGTARGFLKWANSNKVELVYYGIEAGAICVPISPFHGANLIVGDSVEVYEQIPTLGMDLIFLDSCHCLNHVILETIHYSKLVRPGGFLVFHDTAPHIQHTMKDPHGPNTAAFHNSVNLALATIWFPWVPWSLVADRYDKDSPIGGMRVYKNNQVLHHYRPTPEETARMSE